MRCLGRDAWSHGSISLCWFFVSLDTVAHVRGPKFNRQTWFTGAWGEGVSVSWNPVATAAHYEMRFSLCVPEGKSFAKQACHAASLLSALSASFSNAGTPASPSRCGGSLRGQEICLRPSSQSRVHSPYLVEKRGCELDQRRTSLVSGSRCRELRCLQIFCRTLAKLS